MNCPNFKGRFRNGIEEYYMEPKVFFDFDGVLFDSAKEALAITKQLIFNEEPIQQTIQKVEYDNKFLELRYLVGPAWNYYYVDLMIQKGYDCSWYKKTISLPPEKNARRFEENFFQARTKTKKQAYNHWLSLQSPYPFALQVFDLGYGTDIKLVIVSTKDSETVEVLLNHHFPSLSNYAIFGREHYEKIGNKAVITEQLIVKYNLESIWFLDDNIQHLELFENTPNVATLLADWGYNAPNVTGVSSSEVLNMISHSPQLLQMEA